MKCPLCRGGLGRRCMRGDTHAQLSESRRGADDENPGSDFASDGKEDYAVAGSGNHWDERPADATLALGLSGAEVVPGEVFRSERAAFSREAETGAPNSAE